jgi:hypothetical protein
MKIEILNIKVKCLLFNFKNLDNQYGMKISLVFEISKKKHDYYHLFFENF